MAVVSSVLGRGEQRAGPCSDYNNYFYKNYFYNNYFYSFHGGSVNITALNFMPDWGGKGVTTTTTTTTTANITTVFKGSNAQLLSAMAHKLNFSLTLLPSATWDDVTSQVTPGRSMLVPMPYVLLQTRLQLYDFSYPFDYMVFAFALATPLVSPSWLSLYLPLSGAVWLATLLLVCLLPVVLKAALRREGRAVGRTLRILLAQDLPGTLPAAPPYRLLLATWMIFALVFGTAYRGNLTAALTIPKYPKRIESVREMVAYVDRITVSPYAVDHRDSYLASESPQLRAVGRLIQIVPNMTVGLREALYNSTRSSWSPSPLTVVRMRQFSPHWSNLVLLAGSARPSPFQPGLNCLAKTVAVREAHVDGRRYMKNKITTDFTDATGKERLYVGRDDVLPSPAGWIVPHDAPYVSHFNRIAWSTVEAGLYKKWFLDSLQEAKEESRSKWQQRRKTEEEGGREQEEEEMRDETRPSPLSLSHLQGFFVLFSLCLLLALVAFVLEILHSHTRSPISPSRMN
ncbi:Glutamate receptor 1 [Chionoecetes opilio]|uniref:Glutamate receptor 1 n=1 Tax=Chionoecetes opilio TaxID=41210 RepID=A0A8J4Y6J1_CHIOP|nr:Glutamate receptor 1 [Chionoecetes opilio]